MPTVEWAIHRSRHNSHLSLKEDKYHSAEYLNLLPKGLLWSDYYDLRGLISQPTLPQISMEVYTIKVLVKNHKFTEAGNLQQSAWKRHTSHGWVWILGRLALWDYFPKFLYFRGSWGKGPRGHMGQSSFQWYNGLPGLLAEWWSDLHWTLPVRTDAQGRQTGDAQ